MLSEAIHRVYAREAKVIYSKSIFNCRQEKNGNMIISTTNPCSIIYLNQIAANIFNMFDGYRTISNIIDELKKEGGNDVNNENIEKEVIGLTRHLSGIKAIVQI